MVGERFLESISSVWKPSPCAIRAAGPLAVVLLGGVLVAAAQAQVPADMINTKHNLSVSGPGPIRAATETRICIFCHTPHNAIPLSPLWNKELEPQSYTVYSSSTLKSGPLEQPSGPTKLCLSCHDGTIAMGAVVNPAGGIAMAGSDTLPLGGLSNLGLDLSGHHPVSFPYHRALPNLELASSLPADLVFGGTDEMHCITCHDPHNDAYGKFLVKDNRYSALCTTCHQITGWSTSVHAISTASVEGILPRPPKMWPTYTQLNEWGCEACHTPHFAPTAEHLLNFTDVPPTFSCTSDGCHTSDPTGGYHPAGVAVGGTVRSAPVARAPGMVDVGRQTRKLSAHHQPPGGTTMALRSPRQVGRSGIPSVACADCHNPHVIARDEAQAPFASGMVRGVSGIDRNGMELTAVKYEYEVCFKCHADNSLDTEYVQRVIAVTDTRRAFDPANSSYHPVVAMGKNMNIPSIPSSFEPTMTPSVMIYCTTCHADDEGGARGPHGSSFPPILKERYETRDGTPESFDNYALCYRCHDRNSILRDDSFRPGLNGRGGHSGHLRDGATCSTCHDAHGVDDSASPGLSATGSHKHLINFDTRIVSSATAPPFPIFEARGTFSGSCNLCCHNVLHDRSACGTVGALKALEVPHSMMAPQVAPPSNIPVGVPQLCANARVVCGSYP